MRLHVLSDLHLEFADFTPPKTGADVVVLAGDIHVGSKGRDWIGRHFQDTPVIYVLGNHEFYREAIPALTETLRRETQGSHIHLLENSSVEIQGVTFLGCTLWTDFRSMGDIALARYAAEETMSDYQLIRLSPEYRRVRARDTEGLHHQSRRWLEQELAKHEPARTVIVTHHAPSLRSIPSRHAGDLLNAAFASDLGPLILASRVPLWIHGHTHCCVDYRVGETRVLSNQRGYPDELLAEFDPQLVVEV